MENAGLFALAFFSILLIYCSNNINNRILNLLWKGRGNMIAILQKYKMIFIIFAILALAAIICTVILTRKGNEIPMRGVFVMKELVCGFKT